MGFNANEFYIRPAAFAAGGAGTTSPPLVVERDCELVAIAMGVGTVINDAITTMSLWVNGADSGVDILLPVLAANTGGVYYPDAKHYFSKFDTFLLSSDGNAGTNPIVSSTVICRI